jgi:hypothetical protein
VDRLHDLWLKLSAANALGSKLHHRDVVGFALRRLETELDGEKGQDVLRDLGETLPDR